MSDDNSAALASLEAKVTRVEGQVGDLTRSVDRFVRATEQRFATQDIEEKLAAKVPAAPAAAPASESSLRSCLPILVPVLAAIDTSSVGGFLVYVNNNMQSAINEAKQTGRENGNAIIGLRDANAKASADLAAAMSKATADINAALARSAAELAAAGTKSVTDMGNALTKEIKEATASAVPRPELEKSIGGNRAEIDRKVDKDVFSKAGEERDDQIEALRSDNLRLRAESARKDDLAPLWEAVRQTRDQVNDFQRKFVAIPAFPKYNDK